MLLLSVSVIDLGSARVFTMCIDKPFSHNTSPLGIQVNFTMFEISKVSMTNVNYSGLLLLKRLR